MEESSNQSLGSSAYLTGYATFLSSFPKTGSCKQPLIFCSLRERVVSRLIDHWQKLVGLKSPDGFMM